MNQTIYQIIAPAFIGRRFQLPGEQGESPDDNAVTVADIRFEHERWGVPGVHLVLIDEYGIEYPFDIDAEIRFVDERGAAAKPAVGEEWRETTSGRTMTIQEIDETNGVVMLRGERRFTAMPIDAFLSRFAPARL